MDMSRHDYIYGHQCFHIVEVEEVPNKFLYGIRTRRSELDDQRRTQQFHLIT